MSFPELINIKSIDDPRGKLIVLESNKNVPFDMKRIYYILDVDSFEKRGFHAHKNLSQLAFCIKGECKIILDNGVDRKTYHLNSSKKGLFIGNMMWREMYDFSSDCVLAVAASELYDEEDYIRDYEQFKKYSKKGEI